MKVQCVLVFLANFYKLKAESISHECTFADEFEIYRNSVQESKYGLEDTSDTDEHTQQTVIFSIYDKRHVILMTAASVSNV